jgi:S-(hydroxymethyl)glutathione dehydrogenase / alcohol dehydrogenase
VRASILTRVRAAVCHAFGEPLSVDDVDLDSPAAGEVTVDIAACGVCHSDVSYVDGAWGGPLPAVYGHEAAGTVVEVGPTVGTVHPGDRVLVSAIRFCGSCFFCGAGLPALCEAELPPLRPGPIKLSDGRSVEQGLGVGAFAECATVHASQVVPLPDDIELEHACLLGCAVVTGFGAVIHDARVRPGESVVIVGCGGVGLNSVQAAVLAGANPVVAVDLAPEKLVAASSFGATHGVDPRATDVREAVRDLTRGRGADHAIVTAGSGSAVTEALALIRRAGTVTIIGMPAYGTTASFDPAQLAHDGARVVGSKFGSTSPHVDVPMLIDLVRAGRLKLAELISGRFPLDAINEAVDSTRRGDALRNVVLLDARQ